MQQISRTTMAEKIGYSVASLGDSTFYGFISVFLLFFLTTVAGISPGIAGTIVAIGSVWNAFINPIVGYFADKVRSRFGRRRPMILAFSFPLMMAMFLLYTDIQMPMAVKPLYYGFMTMVAWTSYTGFFVPYLALGADYTSDYDDRTVLRMFSSIFNMGGALLAMVLPTLLVEFLQGFGISVGRAWSMTGLLLGTVTFASIIITVAASGRKDPPCPRQSDEAAERENLIATVVNIFREYVSVAKLGPMKFLVAASLLALIGYTMVMSDMVYIFTFNIGLSAVQVSGCMALRAILSLILIPIISKLILMTDRRETLIGCYIVGAVGMVLVRLMDLPQLSWILVYMFFATICTSMYWQIMPGIFYDICEYDRIVNGKSRSATIVSFQGLVEAIAVGIGGQVLGLVLETAGFDGTAAVQTEMAQVWIENAGTVIPIVFLIISSAALYKYPLNKKAYNEMLEKNRGGNI